jgi:hypothetical protein
MRGIGVGAAITEVPRFTLPVLEAPPNLLRYIPNFKQAIDVLRQ